jgi:Xaa-Pro aminopeptidase
VPPHISNASGDKLARYQSFSDESEANASRTRLKRLRIGLAKAGLDGLLVPRADIFQGEYIPACENRVAFLTGFTGSAGFLIVMRNTAALITDGRYTVQARKQVKAGLVEVVPLAEYNPEGYLRKLAGEGARIGYDPALFTPRGLKRFEKAAHEGGFALVALTTDPVAAIWDGRPAQPATPVFDHPIRVAGEAMAEKITRVQAKLAELRVDALLISETPNVNWLLNIRAGDLPHLPLLRAFLLLPRAGKPVLFCDPQRLSPDVAARFAGAVEVVVPATDGAAELEARLLPLAKAGKRIRLDEESAPVRFARFVEAAGGEADIGADPTFLMKARKNATEMSGARAAHLRDGAAMARFLAWLDREIAAGQTLTEIDAAIRLEAFRIETNALVDISFPSISASGPNAALPHYRPLAKANRRITSGLYLIDSGGQYQDGTTDITRTVMIRRTSGDQKEMFTRVLKGVIAISRAVFPKGTSGAQLDSFARAAIWEAGRDFDHGTGHGVGSFLSVHEGPQRLSKLGTTPLEPGMILSNEPGYYREGAYGIRTENLIIVEPREIPGGERAMFGFETITFCPIDRRLILKAMLNRAERDWLDAYHAETLRKIGPLLAGADLAWLEAACAPL